jgi:trigger factor
VKATVERLDGGLVSLEIEVPPEEMAADLEAAFRRVARRVRIPGFRPGKAPAALVERAVGRQTVLDEALNPVVTRAYRNALAENALAPVDQPQIEVQSFEDGQPLQFVAKVPVRPEVELGPYRDVRVPVELPEVRDEQVQESLESLRRMRAKWAPSEEPIADGDMVLLETRGDLSDGSRVTNDRTERVIGEGQLRPEIEGAVRGLTAGASAEVDIEFPQDDPNQRVAGRRAHVEVRVAEVKRQQLPELDDQLAADVSEEFSTLEELRADLRNRLRASAERRARDAAWSAAVDRVVADATFDVPGVLVEQAIDILMDNLEQEVNRAGVALSSYLARIGKTREEMREDMRETALKSVRTELVLEALARAEGLVPGDAEVQEEIHRRAAASGLDPGHYRRVAGRPENVEGLRMELAREGARGWIRDHALAETAPAVPEAAAATTETPEADAGRETAES